MSEEIKPLPPPQQKGLLDATFQNLQSMMEVALNISNFHSELSKNKPAPTATGVQLIHDLYK